MALEVGTDLAILPTMNNTTKANQMDSQDLLVDSDSPCDGPVTLGGWYLNLDDTWTKYRWCDGHVKDGPTVASYENAKLYDSLVEAEIEAYEAREASRGSCEHCANVGFETPATTRAYWVSEEGKKSDLATPLCQECFEAGTPSGPGYVATESTKR